MLPPTAHDPADAPRALSQLHLAAVSPAPAVRAQKLHLMLTQLAARGMGQAALMATVLPLRPDPEAWQELQAIQQAVMKRLQQQQQGWLDGLAALAQGYSQTRQANTLSKYVEQEYNLVAQFGALVADQAAQWMGLLENIQVDCGYWAQQQVNKAAPA